MATAMELAAATRKRTLSQAQPVDAAAVETFLAGAKGATPAQIATVISRMRSDIERGVKARGTDLETMAAVADRLAEMLEGSN